MDGLRAIPDNIPNAGMVAQHLQKPLTAIPDPFGTAESYGHNMNARLQVVPRRLRLRVQVRERHRVLSRRAASTRCCARVLERHDAIRQVVLPTLGAERQETYSPILPISPESGRVLQVPILEDRSRRPAPSSTATRRAGWSSSRSLDGQGKLQWRADWAMRWAALGVDYEMSGKDLINSVKVSSRICRILGGTPPEGFSYELFLDEHGQKISQVQGQRPDRRGVAALRHQGEPEALHVPGAAQGQAAVLRRHPAPRRRLFRPARRATRSRTPDERSHNPVWHIHDGRPPPPAGCRSPSRMLLNLASVVERRGAGGAVGLHQRATRRDATPENAPVLDELVGHALAYYRDFVKPDKALPAARARTSARRWPSWPIGSTGSTPCGRGRLPQSPRRSSRRSTRSASATASPTTCAPGSGRCTRSCSARARGRASARSWRSTGRPRPRR